MKTLQEQYNLIKEGKGHKDVFMKTALRQFPNLFNNLTDFPTAVKVNIIFAFTSEFTVKVVILLIVRFSILINPIEVFFLTTLNEIFSTTGMKIGAQDFFIRR